MAIRQLEERHVATKIELMVWSNKMDLLAFSNTKGEVALHRLNWQRVWLLGPPVENAQVNSLIWRPDGKVIAIAYSTCRVLLINVENKETLHTIIVPSKVTFMSWPQEREKESANNLLTKNTASEYLPKLPSVCRHFRSESEQNGDNMEDVKKVQSQTVLNFLIICLDDGKILISVFGLYSVGQIETNIHLPRGLHCGKILSCVLSKNLAHLYVAVLVTSKATQNIKLLVIDTKMLHDRSKELYTLSMKYGHICSLLEYLSLTTTSLKETWEDILLKEMQLKLINYAKLQPKGQISTDFLELLVFGTPSESLERFLMRELCDKTIKKIDSVIQQNCFTMQRLIFKHLYSFGQNLAYHISELKGMSKLATFSSLGLKEDIVLQGFTSVGAFLVKATEVQYVIDDFVKKHQAFYQWLLSVVVKMTDSMHDNTNNEWTAQQLQFIADYLCTFDELGSCENEEQNQNLNQKIFLDTLGQYFLDKELIKPYKHITNPWETLLEMNPALAKHSIIVPRHTNLSFIQEINNLKTNIDNIFKSTELAINNSIQLKCMHQIKSIKYIPEVSMIHLDLDEEENEKLMLAYIDSENKMFDLIEISEKSDETVMYTCYVSSVNENNTSVTSGKDLEVSTSQANHLNILDVQFFTNEILAVLVENDAETNNSIFLLIDVNIIRNSTQHINIDLRTILESKMFFILESIVARKFSASGPRNVLIVLSESQRKIRLYEFDSEGDEEEDVTINSNHTQESMFLNTSQ